MSEDFSQLHNNIVLVGYSSYFADKNFFIEKTEQALRELNDFVIVAIDDSRGFIQQAFDLHVLEVVSSKDITNAEVDSIFNKVTHALLFWDGEGLTKFVFQAFMSKKPHKIIPVITTKVANRDRGDEYDVYIGRRGPWGNPFHIGQDGDRDEVVNKYRKYFYESVLTDPSRKDALLALRGKRLGCHCKPLACHGDIIAEYLNSLEQPR